MGFSLKLCVTLEEEGQIERQLISVIDSTLSQISMSTIIIILERPRNTQHKGKGCEGVISKLKERLFASDSHGYLKIGTLK